jgi:hypothetical protein
MTNHQMNAPSFFVCIGTLLDVFAFKVATLPGTAWGLVSLYKLEQPVTPSSGSCAWTNSLASVVNALRSLFLRQPQTFAIKLQHANLKGRILVFSWQE